MNTMKKMLALVLALALVFSLAACSDSGEKKDMFGESKTTTAAKAEPTTKAPTEAPTTAAPTTEAPTTEAPTIAELTEDTAEPNGDDPFAAIGNPAIDDSLVGTWIATVDFEKLMAASSEEMAQLGELGEGMADSLKGITMDINFDLRADGTATFGMDEESAKAAFEAMIPALVEVMIPLTISMSGMSEEDFAKALEQQGMTMDDFKKQMMEQFNAEDMMSGMEDAQLNGQWRYADGKLYIVEDGKTADADKYLAVEVSGDKMTLNEIHGEEIDNKEMYDALIPMEFVRQ